MDPSSGERGHEGLDAIFDNILIYVEHTGSVMAEAEYLTTVKNSRGNPEQVTREGMTARAGDHGVAGIYRGRGVHANKQYHRRWALHRYLDLPEQDLGLRCRPGNTAATVKTAIFPRRLLLFYIVYNGGKSRMLILWPV